MYFFMFALLVTVTSCNLDQNKTSNTKSEETFELNLARKEYVRTNHQESCLCVIHFKSPHQISSVQHFRYRNNSLLRESTRSVSLEVSTDAFEVLRNTTTAVEPDWHTMARSVNYWGWSSDQSQHKLITSDFHSRNSISRDRQLPRGHFLVLEEGQTESAHILIHSWPERNRIALKETIIDETCNPLGIAQCTQN
jgi:hypothetical protein